MLSSPAQRCMHAASRQQRHLAPNAARCGAHLRRFQTASTMRKDDAFDPSKTRPEQQQQGAKEEAKEANIGNSADPTSGFDNKQNDPQRGAPSGSKAEKGGGGVERTGQSGGGSPQKNTKA